MLLRKRKPQVALDEVAETLQPDELPQQRAAWAPEPLRAALNGELRRELEHTIAALPEPLRAAVELRDIEGLSTEEAAERLGLSAGAAEAARGPERLSDVATGGQR